MKFHDKLFQLRKKEGLTQAELSEKLGISRQAISKWEMGTAIPDVENMLALSKLFSVSVDYLINETMESELDTPVAKATAAVFKMNFQFIITRVIISFCIIAVVAIVGVLTNSFGSVAICISIIAFFILLYFAVKLVIVFFSHNK